MSRRVSPVGRICAEIDALFSEDAINMIHDTSRGYPRAINRLAVQSLLAAYADNKTIVGETSTRAAVEEVTAG